MISFFIDVAVVGTVVFCGWRGFKNGLIRGVFGIVSLFLALFIANFAAQAYADDAEVVLMPFARGLVESTMTDLDHDGIRYHPAAHDHNIDDEYFGRAYITLREIGLTEAASVAIAEQSMLDGRHDETDRTFVDIVATRLTSSMAFVAVFAVAFLLLAIVFAVIGNLVGVIFSLPGLKLVDMIAGAASGLVKGLVIVHVVAVIVRYFGLVVLPTIERTTVLYFLVNNNPIASMLGV